LKGLKRWKGKKERKRGMGDGRKGEGETLALVTPKVLTHPFARRFSPPTQTVFSSLFLFQVGIHSILIS